MLPGFRGKSLSMISEGAGALCSGVAGRRPPHLHQPSRFPVLSSILMGSSEFPHILSQEGQCGHICVDGGVWLISASCWTLLGPEHHILFHISSCSKLQIPSHEPPEPAFKKGNVKQLKELDWGSRHPGKTWCGFCCCQKQKRGSGGVLFLRL